MGRTVVSRLALCLTGFVVFCIVVVHTTAGSPIAAQKPTTTSLLDDPLAKFAKLMPVFAHPRCVNCHGGVNPFSGDGHFTDMPDDEAAQLRLTAEEAKLAGRSPGDHRLGSNAPCLQCHTDTADSVDWHLAPSQMAFNGRTTIDLCRQLKKEEVTSEELIGHLHRDRLIRVAFRGRKGVPDEPAEFPPMGRSVFLQLAEEWLKGHETIPCGGWTGTITQEETINLISTYNTGAALGIGAVGDTNESIQATRTTTVTFNGTGGPAVVSIAVTGVHRTQGSMTITQSGAACTSNTVWTKTYTGQTTGDVPRATLTMGFGGAYTIEVRGPDETSGATEAQTGNLCSIVIKDDGESQSFDHDAWTIRIEGVLRDPKKRDEIDDSFTETVTHGTPGADRSWFLTRSEGLTGEYTQSDATLAPIPVQIVTTLKLRRVE